MNYIAKYYFREECAYDLIVYLREKVIRNRTLEIDIYSSSTAYESVPAVNYYVDACLKNENEILDLRKTAPIYLTKAKKAMDDFQSN